MFATHSTDFQGAVILALGPALAPTARWSTSTIPTLMDAEQILRPMAQAQCPQWQLALLNNTEDPPLDTPHGHYEPILADLSLHIPTTVRAMSQAFTDMIIPLGSARNTRIKAWRNWRSVLTWAADRRTFDQILPMSTGALQAMLWDFTAMEASRSTLKAVVDAVIARHRDTRMDSPVSCRLSYFRLTRCLGRLLGTQHPHKLGVTRDMIVALLRYRPKNAVEFRDKLVTCSVVVHAHHRLHAPVRRRPGHVVLPRFRLGLPQGPTPIQGLLHSGYSPAQAGPGAQGPLDALRQVC